MTIPPIIPRKPLNDPATVDQMLWDARDYINKDYKAWFAKRAMYIHQDRWNGFLYDLQHETQIRDKYKVFTSKVKNVRI